jgi:two-component system cell cycle sensor histidine kinase/response regulator CckA
MADRAELQDVSNYQVLRLRQKWLAYTCAIALTAIVLPARFGFGFSADQGPALALFIFPIAISAYLGGLGPGLLSTILAAGLSLYYLLSPTHDFHAVLALNRLDLTSLVAAGIFVSIIAERHRRCLDDLTVSEERVRLALDAAGMGTFDWDIVRDKIVWSSSHEALFGYAPGQFDGTYRAFAGRVHPDDLPGVNADVARSRALHSSYRHEYRIVWPDGSVHWVRADAENTFDGAGVATRMCGVVQSVTERKQAQETLRASDEYYRALFESIDVGFCTIQLLFDGNDKPIDYRFLKVNRCFDKMTGIEDAQGKRMREIAPRHEEYWFELFGKIALTGKPKRFEKLAAELHHWYDVYAFRIGDPHERTVAVLFLDITERRQAADALSASEAELRSIVENAPYGIYRTVVEGGGRFIYANPAIVKMLGYDSAEQVLALNVAKDVYMTAADRDAVVALFQSRGEFAGLELQWRKKDGRELTICTSGRIVRGEDGREYFESIAEDVTQRRQLERQLRQAQKMEAVGRLAGGVAHDFNNLLAVITGYSEIAKDKLDADHPVSDYLDQIREAAQRAASLTRQLLMFSRKQIVFPKVLDISAVVNNVVKMLSRTIGEDVVLSFRPGLPFGSIEADVGQIEQILMNLVVNARDAMPDGGQITIETHNVELDENYRVQHEPVIPGSYVMLSVSDTGCGMDDTTLSQMFEPFFTTKEAGKGTGLGLATVYGIVKQSSGHIWVYSEPGKGTTFKVYFPRVQKKADKLGEASEREIVGGTETILLVEDDEGLRGLTLELLRSAGYKVLEAGTPDKAIEIARNVHAPIHLLLTDVVMPKKSGPELSLGLKALLPDLKVIFMSGYAGDALTKQTLLVPDLVLIEKPFSRASLLTTVYRVLRQNDSATATTLGRSIGPLSKGKEAGSQ